MKSQIRKNMKELRKAMEREEVREKSGMAAKHFLECDIYKNSEVMMVYMPIGNETDTEEIIEHAFQDGKRLVLPMTDSKTGIITPVAFYPDAVFKKGGFSVREPIEPEIVDASEIDTVIVPGIAFDRNGARIGFGKGCYDMLLCRMNAKKVGFCYDFQLWDIIPSDSHDIKMDCIVTERELLEVRTVKGL